MTLFFSIRFITNVRTRTTMPCGRWRGVTAIGRRRRSSSKLRRKKIPTEKTKKIRMGKPQLFRKLQVEVIEVLIFILHNSPEFLKNHIIKICSFIFELSDPDFFVEWAGINRYFQVGLPDRSNLFLRGITEKGYS